MLTNLQKSIAQNQHRIAVCIEGQAFSYADLDRSIRQIYGRIMDSGGSASCRVGLVTDNCLETYASILACWFAGYAYIPINPAFPEERNSSIVEQAGIDLFLSPNPELIAQSSFITGRKLINSAVVSSADQQQVDYTIVSEKADTILYILFTSGSTGVPKGVPITLGNIEAFLCSYEDLGFVCDSEDRFLQMFDLTFDVSVASYLVPLLMGASFFPVSSEGLKYMQVYKVLRNQKITFASLVPSVINLLKPYFEEISLPDLRYCIFTAEASQLGAVHSWSACIPNAYIWNLYGPTEATIWCTGYQLNMHLIKSYNNMVGIGKAFSQVEAMILDEAGIPVSPGKKGELCLRGTQLSVGYLNDPSRTEAQFKGKGDQRYYKTGDICYFDSDGDIIYCGRADHQVKISGFRIELSEIEVAARKIQSHNVVAISYKSAAGMDQICLFVEGKDIDTIAMKQALVQHLPYYMAPTQVRTLEQFPLNTSGKIDRPRLLGMCQE